MSTTLYTSEAAVVSRAGQLGVDLRTDDDTAAAGYVADCIEDASGDVEFYCQPRYSAAALDGNRWVAARCTDIALYHLCTRRMEEAPASVKDRYDKAIEQLEKVQSGEAAIPGAPRSRGAAPAMVNQRVNLNRHPATRTEPSRSTGDAQGYNRRIDPTDGGAVR